MSSFKLDAVQFEAFAQKHPSVQIVPRELPEDFPSSHVNAMLVPGNWASEVVLETRWQTDVTSGRTGPRERWALADKPARTLSARLTGPTEGASYTILQALTQAAFVEGPVPIYPDAVGVQAAEDLGSGSYRIEGDFRYRRFFPGARVVVFAFDHPESRSQLKSFFATVTSVAASEMIIAAENAEHRLPVVQDLVAPCMDCEWVESAQGTAITDGVFDGTFNWTEREGLSSLPALWPAFFPAEPETIAPLVPTVSVSGTTLPLFNLTFNWAPGVDVDVRHDVDSSTLGRSRILERVRDPHLAFGITIVGHDREACWKALRFFDAMRGRHGEFVFLHPFDVFEMQARVSSTVLELKTVGDPSAARRSLRYVYVTTNAGAVVRKVVSVTDLGATFRIQLDSALPGSTVSAVRHALICSFDSDTLTETWSTSTVSEMSFTLVESDSFGTVTAPTNSLRFVPAITDPIRSVPGCTLFLKAGSRCFDPYGVESTVWPGYGSRCIEVQDVSTLELPNGPYLPVKKATYFGTNKRNRLVRLHVQEWFNNQPVFYETPLRLSYLTPAEPNLSIYPWGPQGWTGFIVFSPRLRPVSSPQLKLQTLCLFQALDFRFEIRVEQPNPPGTLPEANLGSSGSGFLVRTPFGLSLHTGPAILQQGSALVLTFRINFADNSLRCWINGKPYFPSVELIQAGWPQQPALGEASLFTMAEDVGNTGTFRSDDIPTAVANRLLGAAFVCYDRPLSDGEMTQVGGALGKLYSIDMLNHVLY